MCLIQPLLPNRQPHLPVAYPVSTDEALMPESDRISKIILKYCNVLGFSIHDGTLLHSKSQYTTVKHSRKLFEHPYMSNPHGLRTLIPIEFFQQDLLWQSSNTHSHSCSQKASKHMSGQSIVGLSVHNGTSVYTSLTCHLPAPTHKHVCPRTILNHTV
jgi:hypothetical protein